MTKHQTVSGIFNTLSEAQKVVQLLLSSGFATDTIAFSAQAGPLDVLTREKLTTNKERNTGRFLFTLFGPSADDQPTNPDRDETGANTTDTSGTLVTVQVQSVPEVDLAVDLLKGGRSVTVSELTQ